MKPIVLFRKSMQEEGEFEIAKQYFDVVEHRSDIPPDRYVIGRYSVLPYYNELEYDINSMKSKLINSHREHLWIANFDYYESVKEFTPKTWREFEMVGCDHPGPFVVKGATNSRKHQWNTMMFAKTKPDALRLGSFLATDPLLGSQGLIYREFVKLKTYEIGLNDLPFSHEFRFFFYKQKLLSFGYYWSMAENTNVDMDGEGIAFAKMLADIIKDHATFFVIDIAKTEEGKWIMIELGDAQMAGPSCNDMHFLYRNLKIDLEA